MAIASPIAQLNAEHRNFFRLLDVLDGHLLRAMDPDGKADFVLMLDIMLYMTDYPELFHHPREDLIFIALAVRNRSTRTAVAKLREEHKSLAENGHELLGTLRAVAHGRPITDNTLGSRGRGYVSTLRAHMEAEEGTLFPLAERYLKSEDWSLIEREIEQMADPLFGDVVHDEYRGLFRTIMRQNP